jgi:hypothetical protein
MACFAKTQSFRTGPGTPDHRSGSQFCVEVKYIVEELETELLCS